jgi:RNase H-fold protein (predicted Holliday junction resolvase)
MTVKELKKITENLDDETQVFVTFADESLSSADTIIDAYTVSGSKEEINGLYLERY